MATFGDLKTLFAYKYGETGAPATGAEVRNKFINLAVKNILDRRKWKWRLKDGSATTDGTASLSIASDLSADGIKDFKIAGEEWTEINEGDEVAYSSDSTVFYVTGNVGESYTVHFPNAVPETGQSVSYRYWRDHTEYTQDSDACIIPKPEAVADLAVGMFLKSEGDADEAAPFLEDAENGIGEMEIQNFRASRRTTVLDAPRGRDVNDVKSMY